MSTPHYAEILCTILNPSYMPVSGDTYNRVMQCDIDVTRNICDMLPLTSRSFGVNVDVVIDPNQLIKKCPDHRISIDGNSISFKSKL